MLFTMECEIDIQFRKSLFQRNFRKMKFSYSLLISIIDRIELLIRKIKQKFMKANIHNLV